MSLIKCARERDSSILALFCWFEVVRDNSCSYIIIISLRMITTHICFVSYLVHRCFNGKLPITEFHYTCSQQCTYFILKINCLCNEIIVKNYVTVTTNKHTHTQKEGRKSKWKINRFFFKRKISFFFISSFKFYLFFCFYFFA